MLFACYCVDKPDHDQVRSANRPAHLEYLKGKEDRIVAAGAMLAENGQRAIGSLLIIDVEDRAAAEAFLAGDPYGKAGLFESTIVRPWRKAFFRAPPA